MPIRAVSARATAVVRHAMLAAVTCIVALPAQAMSDAKSCKALASQALPDTVIASAQWVPSRALAALAYPAAGASPAHCLVKGEIDARTGIVNPDTGSDHYAVGFELRLPADWNGRFFYQGGGGADGYVWPAVGTVPGQSKTQQTPALWRGYAVLSTDGGHNSGKTPLAITLSGFGVDPQARIDYGYASIGKSLPVADALIRSYYGTAAQHRYFGGCSKGGQEALQAAQRYGAQFDGVIAGDPGFHLPHAAIAEAASTQALAKAAQAMNPAAVDVRSGKPLLWAALSKSDLQLVVDGVLQACDALDGLADKMIFNPKACAGRFDPSRLQCSGAKQASCLAPVQVEALHKIFSPLHSESGLPIYASFPYDTGFTTVDYGYSFISWRMGYAGLPVNAAFNTTLAQGSSRYLFVSPPDADLDVFSVSLDDFLQRIQATGTDASTGAVYDTSAVRFMEADSLDYSALRGHGGRLLVYHGESDPVFSLDDITAYFGQLDQAYGTQREDFARLFVVPGMGHCGSGDYAADSFDTLSAMENWVERAQPPQTLLARPADPRHSLLPSGTTRPLCAWPQYAAYRGSGDTLSADSFVCTSP